jgi:tetratricopeptide (TPR) repeat protein
MYRLLAKAGSDDTAADMKRADDALQQALRLNPDLSMAHNLYAQIEVDRGEAPAAMTRLFERLRQRGANAELYAGLVQACRFGGLLEESIAAHQRAVALDPATLTGVMHAYFVMRRWEDVVAASGHVRGYVYSLSLNELGRGNEALAALADLEQKGGLHDFILSARELIAGRAAESAAALGRALQALADPESFYYAGRHFARLGEDAAALTELERSADGGYSCVEPLMNDPWLNAVRSHPRFQAVLSRARERHAEALHAFELAGGADLLK